MRLLIVEDERRHLDEALLVLFKERIGYTIERNSNDALRVLKNSALHGTPKVDGVITDIYMPESEKEPWNDASLPCGLAVALEAERLGIPFVFCTNSYHHSTKLDWICGIGRSRGWPEIVDNPNYQRPLYNDESVSKNWQKAVDEIKRLIALRE